MIKRSVILLLLFLTFCAFSIPLLAQDSDASLTLIAEDAKREEIQRYFGYEDLLYRYLTLPYDISVQVNQQGRYVDIGYALFALIPLVILFFLYSKKKWFYGFMILIVVYLFICLRFSFLFDTNNVTYNPITNEIPATSEFVKWDGALLAPVYQLSSFISGPFTSLTTGLTGEKDHITYPILILSFLGILFFLLSSKRLSEISKVIGIIALSFFFFWWILSGGIIWYGLLLIPLGYAFIMKGLIWGQDKDIKTFSIFKKLIYLSVGIWVIIAYALRVSNVNVLMKSDHPDMAKLIMEPRLVPYSVGMISAKQAVEISAQNVGRALDQINSDSSLIFQVGTSLAFEIKNNHKRIFEDNNLSYFYELINRYKDKESFTSALKSYGFKYILIDLMLPTLDRTPEKSLREKYSVFLGQIIANNPRMALIATDRAIIETYDDGTKRQKMGVFGSEIAAFGTYAVYQIL